MSRTFTTELEAVHISEDLIPTKTTYHLQCKLISENSSLLGCYALSLDEQRMSQRIIPLQVQNVGNYFPNKTALPSQRLSSKATTL